MLVWSCPKDKVVVNTFEQPGWNKKLSKKKMLYNRFFQMVEHAFKQQLMHFSYQNALKTLKTLCVICMGNSIQFLGLAQPADYLSRPIYYNINLPIGKLFRA